MKNQNEKNNSEVISGDSFAAFFNEEESTEAKAEEGTTQKVENEEEAKPKSGDNMDDMFTKPEKKEEEPPKRQEEKKAEEPEPKKENKSSFYTDLISEFIEDGDWADVDVEMEVDGETKVIPIKDLENVTPERFKELKQLQKELKEQDFESKYVSVEGLDDTTKKLIELKKSGGDISQLIEQEAKYVNPIANLDLEDERVQEYLVRQKYQHQNLEEDIIDMKIQKLKENLTLDSEAEKVSSEITNNYKRFVDAEAKKQQDLIAEQKKQQKEFRKTMSQTFKSLDIEDKKVKSILDAATVNDETGLSTVEKAFAESKNNPELFAKISLLLTDEDAFKEVWGGKIKNEVTKRNIKTILSLKNRSSEKSSAEPKKKKQGLGALMDD